MSDSDNNKGKTLSLGKNFDSGTVKQNLSRGRSKTVTVEVRKSRNFKSGTTTTTRPVVDDGLSDEERNARLKALEAAEKRKTEQAEEQAKQVEKTTIEVSESLQDKVAASIEEETKSAKENNNKKAENTPPSSKSNNGKNKAPINRNPKNIELEKELKIEAELANSEAKNAKEALEKEIENKKRLLGGKPKGGGGERRQKKLTISQALDFDGEEKVRSLASIQRQRQKNKKSTASSDQEFKTKEIIIPEIITVQELANRMAVRVQDVIKELMKLGMMNRAGDEIDADTAELIVTEFKHTPRRVSESDIEDILNEEDVPEEDLESRPAVVTVMGHVDHGKTSLLDALRKTNVTSGEAGGITQHIGAYQITTDGGQKVTFIDTPGHAAFTEMRARGANVTDIVILLVAADDGIMPQTIEAINHSKAADVPIIVAVNKIDKPDANPQIIKDALLQHEVVTEEYGGDVQLIEVSAKEGLNLDALVEAVLLQAELLDLKASPMQRPRGTVIESKVDKGKGVVTTLLVQKGTLQVGDIVVAGTAWGKIKSISDETGRSLSHASPSRPVEVLGFDEPPAAGEVFAQTDTEKTCRDVVDYRKKLELVEKNKSNSAGGLDSLFSKASGKGKSLNIILKSDVHGSNEAITGAINKIESDEVTVKIVHSAAGAITESDVQLALATNAIILGFNVRAEAYAKTLAETESIDIRYYNIIYNLIDDVKGLVSGLLSPIIREQFLGNAQILDVFKITKAGKVAGCKISEGIVKRGAGVRLIRDNVVIHEGKLKTLKRFKEEVSEVKEGYECGMAFENYEDIKSGDVIEAYEIVEEARTLADD